MSQGPDFFSAAELLFVVLALANVAALACAAWPARSRTRGPRTPAIGILRALAIGDGIYLLLVLLTSFHRPEPSPAPRIGDPLCLGHRCITLEGVTRRPSASGVTYEVALLLSNSARLAYRDRVSGVYLIDDRGRRYAPTPDASDRSLTAELEPGQTATARRIFTLPAEVRATGFVVERGTGPSVRCLFIGGNCWLPRPPQPPVVIE